jgi:hypothetical protein
MLEKSGGCEEDTLSFRKIYWEKKLNCASIYNKV